MKFFKLLGAMALLLGVFAFKCGGEKKDNEGASNSVAPGDQPAAVNPPSEPAGNPAPADAAVPASDAAVPAADAAAPAGNATLPAGGEDERPLPPEEGAKSGSGSGGGY